MLYEKIILWSLFCDVAFLIFPLFISTPTIEASGKFLRAQKATIITVYEEFLLKGDNINISVVPAWKWLLGN